MELTELCYKCQRLARWWWPGSKYEPGRYCCGYHKRAFVPVWLISEIT